VIGGMPAAVNHWITQTNLSEVNRIHNDLLSTYRDDFTKYHGRLALEHLEETMLAIPQMLGKKFVFSQVNPLAQAATIKKALKLLGQARICHQVTSCSANGIPLLAEQKEKYFKQIFLDTGLCHAALGLNFKGIHQLSSLSFINNGGIAEQVVGQLLRTIFPFYIEPKLHYWQRHEKGGEAEIDYVIQLGQSIIPIEVKAGSTGSLKSLHMFMGLKQLSLAARINAETPSQVEVAVKNQLDQNVRYQLISLPFYLIEQIPRLLSTL
jgi:hypothetical protein